MPTYTVQVQVNVPSVGSKTFTTTGIVSPTPEDAMVQAKAGILVQVVALQQTAP